MNRCCIVVFLILFILNLNLGAQTPDLQTALDEMNRSLNEFEKKGFSGSVLVSVNDTIVLHQGYGYTHTDQKYKVTPKTLFNVASITKSFTAMGVLKLTEQKKLKLADRIGKYLKRVPQDKKYITIKHLLTHTSGLQQHYVNSEVGSRDSAVRNILKDSLKSPPGEQFTYSNENYELLAAIIEVITGTSFESYINEVVLKPAGMRSTFFWGELNDLDPVNVAQKIRNISPKSRQRNWDFLGSGGIFTTCMDLYNLYLAVKSNKILTPKATRSMVHSHQKLGDTDAGYGWFIRKTRWHTSEIWTRGTEDFGHNAVMRWFPSEEVVIIVCSNAGKKLGDTTANRIVGQALTDIILPLKHKVTQPLPTVR